MPPRSLLLAFALAALGIARAEPPAQGDPGRGATLFDERCAACHGTQGQGGQPGHPRLAGQFAGYLQAELKAYRDGQRPSPVMQGLAQALTDAQAADLAAYLAGRKPAPGVVGDTSLLALGKKVYLEGNPATGVPSCDGCHEEGGEGSARFPRLAGQDVAYTLEQFRLYAAGQRPYGKKVMRTIAERLSEAEARAVAEYLASLP